MIACLLLAFPTSGYGPVCTFIDDRDGDGRVELVMSTTSESKNNGNLMVWSSRTHTVLERVRLPGSSDALVGDAIPVDATASKGRLLVSDLWCRNEQARSEGAVYLLDKDLKMAGEIRSETGERMFGSRLAASAVQGGEQLLAVQLQVLDVPTDEYSGREWFAIYSLGDLHRRGIIKGSSQFTGFRHASVVCMWVPDCNGDGVQDLAIDMRDRIVLYSGKDLLPIRVLPYTEYLTEGQYFGRSLACVHMPDGTSALVLGLPTWFIGGESSCMLQWSLEGHERPTRIENPGKEDGFGCALCQTRNGDCFASGVAAFDGTLSFAGHEAPTRFRTIMTQADGTVMIGSAVRCVGDFDGDGVEDVAVTQFNREADGWPGQGVVVVSGKAQCTIGRIELDDRDRYVWR